MEGRMKKHRELSPERAKVWKERSPKYVQNRKVPVVYYLCRNRQLEHPHFIEVPISSPDGLYLRDVIEKLNNLRGRGMASMYSWSCKRSYKSGLCGMISVKMISYFQLTEMSIFSRVLRSLKIPIQEVLPIPKYGAILPRDDIVESICLLTGLLNNVDEMNFAGRFSPVAVYRMHNLKQLPEPPTCRSQEDTSTSMSSDGKETKHPREDEISPPSQRSGSSGVSPESRAGSHSPWDASLSLTEYKVPKSEGATDASTQTEENIRQAKQQKETCTRGVSTEDGTLDSEHHENNQNQANCTKQNSETCENSVSPLSSSSASSGGKAETLESLIRSDMSKINSFRRPEEEDSHMPSSTKMKASNMLMQLISCGSISVKDHRFGLIPIYRPRFSDSKFPSPLYSTSVMLGELDCLSDNSRLMGLKLEDKEYFSGSLVETKMPKEKGDGRTLKRSSSYNADRSSKQLESVDNHEEATSMKTKCIPRSIKTSLSKPRSESLRSPISDKPRVSSDGGRESSRIISHDASNGSSKRMSEPSSAKNPSTRANSFREEEKIFKIEESWLQEPGS